MKCQGSRKDWSNDKQEKITFINYLLFFQNENFENHEEYLIKNINQKNSIFSFQILVSKMFI